MEIPLKMEFDTETEPWQRKNKTDDSVTQFNEVKLKKGFLGAINMGKQVCSKGNRRNNNHIWK